MRSASVSITKDWQQQRVETVGRGVASALDWAQSVSRGCW